MRVGHKCARQTHPRQGRSTQAKNAVPLFVPKLKLSFPPFQTAGFCRLQIWARLRNDQLGVTFRCQHAIGSYIPDFCSPKAKLIIELDGSQHLEQEEYDKERTKYLESQSYKVLRFWNNDVLNDIEGVILAITQALEVDSNNS